MSAIDASGGLCMTCNNAPGCYHRARRGPALFCEMFDSYVARAERGDLKQAAPGGESPVAFRAPEEASEKYGGLCVNCTHRATCTHPRPTGGVWHCEDYE